MHLYVIFAEGVLGISAGHLCNKTVESEDNSVVGSSLTLRYERISGFPH